jgi:hypothetical protein
MIRVGPRAGSRGIRAAEPVSASTPLPKIAAAPGRGREARQASIGNAAGDARPAVTRERSRGPESIFRSLDNGRSASGGSAAARPSSLGFNRPGRTQNENAGRAARPGTLTSPTTPGASRGPALNGQAPRGNFPEYTSPRRPSRGVDRDESLRGGGSQARAPRGGGMSGPAFGGREFRAPAARGGAPHASRPAQTERHNQGRTAEPRKHSRRT